MLQDEMEPTNHLLRMAQIRKTARNPSNSLVLSGNDANPEEASDTEEPLVEDCASRLNPKDAEKLGVDDKSSSLDENDAMLVARASQLIFSIWRND